MKKPTTPIKTTDTNKSKRIKTRFAGGSYYQIPTGSYSAQISVCGIQHKSVRKTPEEAETWIAKVAAKDIPLTSWQLSQAKNAFALVAEQGGGKDLIECLQIGLNTTSITAITLGSAIDEYLKAISKSIQPITLNDYRLYLLQLQKALGDDLNLLALSRVKVSEYLDQYKEKPYSYNHALRSISAFVNWAIDCEYIQVSPLKGMKKQQIIKENISYLDTKQTKAFILAAAKNRPDMMPYITISLFAGLRPYECMKLTANDINLNTGNIRLGAAKTKSKKGGGRMIKINDTLKSWLDLYPVEGQVTKLKPVSINLVMRQLATASQIALAHDVLRHTYATHAHAAYANPEATAQAMGHSVATAKSHYVGLITEKDGKEFFAITPETLISSGEDEEKAYDKKHAANVETVRKFQRVGKAKRKFEEGLKSLK